MPNPCALDLVMEVTRRFLLRRAANSNANRMMRSTPRRVNTEVWMATSSGWW